MSDPRKTTRWRKLRAELYRRDRAANAPCWICHQPIDYRARAGTPDSWEPDHVRDVARFPQLAFDPANIMPAHCSCNRSRGDRDLVPMGSSSRAW